MAQGPSGAGTSFDGRIAGLWLLTVEAAPLNRKVELVSPKCGPLNNSIELARSFASSLRQSLGSQFSQIEEISAPVPDNVLKQRGARGIIFVRVQDVRASLHVDTTITSAQLIPQIFINASVIVHGPRGQAFNSTVEGEGVAAYPEGFLCGDGAEGRKSIVDAAEAAVRETASRVSSALNNSESLRSLALPAKNAAAPKPKPAAAARPALPAGQSPQSR